MKCSTCLVELNCAIVFPEHGLRLCLDCLERINTKVREETVVEVVLKKVPSSHEAAGPASVPVPSLSRDDTPSSEGER